MSALVEVYNNVCLLILKEQLDIAKQYESFYLKTRACFCQLRAKSMQ